MKKKWLIWIFSIILYTVFFLNSWYSEYENSNNYVPWEVLVKYKTQSNSQKGWIQISSINTLSTLEKTLEKDDFEIKSTISDSDIAIVSIKNGMSVEDTIEVLEKNPNIEHVEPNYIFHTFSIDTDPLGNFLWWLNNNGLLHNYTDTWYYNDPLEYHTVIPWEDIDWIKMRNTFSGSFSQSSPGSVVAVVDEWVNYNHEDLKNQMRDDWDWHHWKDFVQNDNDPLPSSTDSHWTHVAWTIAAEMNNWKWIFWVNPNSKIMSIKVMENWAWTYDTIISWINYAITNDIKIINASFWWTWSIYPNILEDAINKFKKIWWLFIAAAGNEGDNNDNVNVYPCNINLDNIICVSATTTDKQLAKFSNYWNSVDVWAPWIFIHSTSIDWSNYTNYYEDKDWTSMATPHVAGLASLARSFRPNASYSEIKEAILNNWEDFTYSRGWVTYHSKRINAYNTLYALDNYAPINPTLTSPESWYITEIPSNINFKWSTTTDTGVWVSWYIFELSNSSNFNSLITWITLSSTWLSLNINSTWNYYWRVKAFDLKWNIWSWNIFSFSVKNDGIPSQKPSCSISQDPASWTWTNSWVTLTINYNTENTQPISWYSWDNLTYSLTQTKIVTAIWEYTAYVKDISWNTGSCSIQVNNIDNTPPTCWSWSYEPSLSTRTNWNVTATLGNSTDSGWAWTNKAWWNCTITEYNGTCDVTITDNAWNSTTCTSDYAAKMDKVSPTISFNKPNGTTNTSHSIVVSASDNWEFSWSLNIKYRWQTESTCSNNESEYSSTTLIWWLNSASTTLVLDNSYPNWDYYLCILNWTISDKAWNKNSWNKAWPFSLTNIEPYCNITANPSSWTNGNVILTATVNMQNPDKYSWTWFEEMSSALTTLTVSENWYKTLYIKDSNWSTGSCSINVNNIDKTPPSLQINYSTTTCTSSNVTVRVNAEDSISWIHPNWYSRGNSINSTRWTSTENIMIENWNWTVYVRDNALNYTWIQYNVSWIDKTSPTLTPNNANWHECSLITWSVNANDEWCWSSNLTYSWNGFWAWTTTEKFGYKLMWVWTRTWNVRVIDWAWNTSSSVNVIYSWTDTLPTLSSWNFNYSTKITSSNSTNIWNIVTMLWVIDWECWSNYISAISVNCSNGSWLLNNNVLTITAPSNSEWTSTCTITFIDDENNSTTWSFIYTYNTKTSWNNSWWWGGGWGGWGWWWGWGGWSKKTDNKIDDKIDHLKDLIYWDDDDNNGDVIDKIDYLKDLVGENDDINNENNSVNYPVNTIYQINVNNGHWSAYSSNWFLEWPSQEVLTNGYTRELNNAYSFAYINWITTMNSIKNANMNWRLKRIEMAKMLSNYAIRTLWKIPDTSKSIAFWDVSSSLDAQYGNWVTLAYQLWIMWQNMKNNNFRPDDIVTRAEFATALSRLLYWTKDWSDSYYSTHLEKLYLEWIISNTNPNMHEVRWYVMLMLMRSSIK